MTASGMPGYSEAWRASDAQLVTRHWNDEDEWVIFNPLSGDVHLVNAAAHQLLQALAEKPMTAEALVAHLATAAGRLPDAELESAVTTALAALDAAGLIQPFLP